MNSEDIKKIIKRLTEQYIYELEVKNYSNMVDVHDEIDRWERMLKEKYE